MSRRRDLAALAGVAVMAVLGGLACGRYGPPVRGPDVVERPASEVETAPIAADDPSVGPTDDDSGSRRPPHTSTPNP
jgi:hypothetical protein